MKAPHISRGSLLCFASSALRQHLPPSAQGLMGKEVHLGEVLQVSQGMVSLQIINSSSAHDHCPGPVELHLSEADVWRWLDEGSVCHLVLPSRAGLIPSPLPTTSSSPPAPEVGDVYRLLVSRGDYQNFRVGSEPDQGGRVALRPSGPSKRWAGSVRRDVLREECRVDWHQLTLAEKITQYAIQEGGADPVKLCERSVEMARMASLLERDLTAKTQGTKSLMKALEWLKGLLGITQQEARYDQLPPPPLPTASSFSLPPVSELPVVDYTQQLAWGGFPSRSDMMQMHNSLIEDKIQGWLASCPAAKGQVAAAIALWNVAVDVYDRAYMTIFEQLLESLKVEDFPAHVKEHVYELVNEMVRHNWREIFKVGDGGEDAYAAMLHASLKKTIQHWEGRGFQEDFIHSLSQSRFGVWALRDCIYLIAAACLSKPPLRFICRPGERRVYDGEAHEVTNLKPGIANVKILFPALKGLHTRNLCVDV